MLTDAPTIKVKVRGREVFVLGAGKRELMRAIGDTKAQAIRRLAEFINDCCNERGI